ncbi:DUF3024 domain-containing protein, partial [Treponema sp.]|uniref:DUF3024 domain-containing protein n=1 Tax=Treponema sp. TaxID=166 RepID=UPI003FD753EE
CGLSLHTVRQFVQNVHGLNEDIIFPVAKTTYMKTENRWKILWQRRDLKWHAYEPDMFVDDFEGFLKVVDEDACCAFWG